MSFATRLRGILLTTGAVVGGLCLLAAVAAVVFGVKPLLFTSGSMGPTIPAGSVAFARAVPADQLEVGDIVSVLTKEGARVTHRVVTVNGSGERRILVLKGDANKTPDAETYPVTSADRVMWSVPYVGYAIAFLRSPLGLFLLGACAAGILFWGFRAQPSPRAHRPGAPAGPGVDGAGRRPASDARPWSRSR